MGDFINPENITGLVDLGVYANTATQGMFWSIMLFSFFLVMFLGFGSVFPREDSLAGASFIALILAVLAQAMGFVEGIYMIAIFGVLLMISFGLMYNSVEL